MRSITKISLFVFFFILSSSYNPQKNYFHIKVIFPIKNIIIENTKTVNPNELKKKFRYLLEKSIFFIDKKIIRKVVLNNEFISSIKIKKIYPNTIKIIVNEEKPIAIQVLGNKKFYVTNENLLIKFYDLETYKNLPLIFGKQEGFNSLYILLNNIEFPLNEVKAFYYFDIKRWDISLKSNRIIKLPVENHLSSLKNYMKIKDNRSFDKYEIFDYRIKDQLILK